MSTEQDILRGAAIDFWGSLVITFVGVFLIFGVAI